jgi:hypothetical protein
MKNGIRISICSLTMAVFGLALPAVAQMTSVGIDCSQINALHLLQQDNLRAGRALIECGIIQGGRPTTGKQEAEAYPQPPNILVSNRSCIGPTTCTKSENMVASSPDGQTIVVNYNDHPDNYATIAGTSYSTNGGATFTEIEPPPFVTGHGTVFGDPIAGFNKKLNLFFAGDLSVGCGGQGIGLWTSPDGINWTTGACAHSGHADDRDSMWIDNDPTSAGYGRMYISFNNFSINGGVLEVLYSDDGNTWNEVQLSSGFIRDVQITGAQVSPTPKRAALNGYNSVFIASMDEGGGGLNVRQNVIWRSNNGGVTWTEIVMGDSFPAAGDDVCGNFARMNPIWRYQGWGEPAVGPNNVVHYVFAGHGTGSDNGDIFYTRSTDNGATWSTPIVLNTDTPGIQYHTQWMPSLSVNSAGKLTASWYDRRSVNSACNSATDPGCNYERYGRQSPDNGVTWGADFAISSSIIPQPQQQDPVIPACYVGDYDYDIAQGGTAFVTWTDGRRNVNGVQVQDVNLAAVPEQ